MLSRFKFAAIQNKRKEQNSPENMSKVKFDFSESELKIGVGHMHLWIPSYANPHRSEFREIKHYRNKKIEQKLVKVHFLFRPSWGVNHQIEGQPLTGQYNQRHQKYHFRKYSSALNVISSTSMFAMQKNNLLFFASRSNPRGYKNGIFPWLNCIQFSFLVTAVLCQHNFMVVLHSTAVGKATWILK